jgi:hypothetical protein
MNERKSGIAAGSRSYVLVEDEIAAAQSGLAF